MPTSSKRAICLVTDGLSVGYLGAYGNQGIQTPCFDRLASRSLLLDQALIDSPNLDEFYTSALTGTHAAVRGDGTGTIDLLPSLLSDRGIATHLLTDDSEVAEHRCAASFDDGTTVAGAPLTASADFIETTELARFFAAAADAITDLGEGQLLWLHTKGMRLPWDGPLELRAAYADEEDPDPPTATHVPQQILPDDDDPDHRLGITQSYAGQVSVWDACLGGLVEATEMTSQAEETLLIVISPRGFPLGEHHVVGFPCDVGDRQLHAEGVHIPWLVHRSVGAAASLRSSALVQPADLYTTLLAWWNVTPPQPAGGDGWSQNLLAQLDLPAQRRGAAGRDRAVVAGNQAWALRSPAWYQIHGQQPPGEIDRLYVKPDDRWEMNDVAARCPDVVSAMRSVYRDTIDGNLQALDDLLAEGLE